MSQDKTNNKGTTSEEIKKLSIPYGSIERPQQEKPKTDSTESSKDEHRSEKQDSK
jgi:hypothetical protein